MGPRVASPSRRLWAVAVVGLALALHAWVGHQFALTMAAWHDQGPAMAPVEVVVEGALVIEADVATAVIQLTASLEDPGKYTVHKFEAVKEDASSRPFPVGVVGGTTTTTGRGGSGEYRGSKAERRAARKLETEAKLRYKQTLQFTCEGFSAYKNQQGEYGCLYGSAKTTGMANPIPLGVEISGVKRSTWEAYDQFRGGKGPIPIQAINVRTGATKRRVVVGSFLFDLEDWFSKRGDKSGGTTKEGTVVRTCRGPNGHLIPETFFNELVRQGCSHCGGNLDIDDAQSIVWGGEYGKSPICAPCTRQFMAESDKQQKGKMN